MKKFSKFLAIALVVLSIFGCVLPLSASAASSSKTITVNIDNAFCSATNAKSGDKITLTLTTGGWVKSTSWSSSDTSVAKIEKQNNKLSADIKPVSHGEANIKITINYYLKKSETITYKFIVYDEKIINIKPLEQKTNYDCAGASAYSTLRGLGVKYNGDDLSLYNSLGTITIGNIAKKIKSLSGKNYYADAFYNRTAFEKAVITSLNKGYPVVIRITLKSASTPFKYTTHGHFVTISGYTVSARGDVQFTITDSWKIKTNSGTFKVSSSDLYTYARTSYKDGKFVTNGCGCWIAASK
jgi:hypothetical protein